MANNITNIYFSNTFGDLVRTANNLVNAWQYLGFYNWDKPSGKFSISSAGTGFEANTVAVFKLDTRVEGFGSSLYVQNNAEVGKLFSLTDRANNVTLYSNGASVFSGGHENYASYLSDVGYQNANNRYSIITTAKSLFANNVDILNTANVDFIQSNNIIIAYNTSGDTAQFSGNVAVENFVSNNYVYATNNLSTNKNLYVALNSYVIGTTLTNNLQSNNTTNTSFLSVTNNSYTNNLQANSVVLTSELVANNTVTTNTVAANSLISTKTTVSSSNVITNSLQSNNTTNTSFLSVTNNSYTNNLQANNNISTKTAEIEIKTNTQSLFVSQNSVSQVLYSNTNIICNGNSNSNNSYITNTLFANTIGGLDNSGNPLTKIINSKDAVLTEATVTNRLTVVGGLTVVGTTSYDGNSIKLSSNTPSWFANVINIPAEIRVNRTYDGGNNVWYSSNADAALSWSETTKRWRAVNVVTSGSNTSPVYTNIIVSDDISDTFSETSSSKIPSSRIANILFTLVSSANANTIITQGVDSTQNTNISNLTTWLSSNVSLQTGINATQNSQISTIESVNSTQNTNISNLTTWLSSNVSLQTGINATQNTNISNLTTFANFGRIHANSAFIHANSAFNTANLAYTHASSSFNKANTKITVNGSTGLSVSGSPVGLGGTLTLTNTGVTSLSGTTNRVTVSGSTGSITISAPQDIHTGASPTFNGLTTNGVLNSSSRMYAYGSQASPISTSTGSLGGIEVQGPNNTSAAFIAFHRPGAYATYFGLGTNNRFQVGGWSAGSVAWDVVLNDGGTYGINITGNADTVDGWHRDDLRAWGNLTGKPFNYSGQSGQPSWLWGTNDGTSYYIWNPSNFSVNYANSAGNADTVDGYHHNQDLRTSASPSFSTVTVSNWLRTTGTSGWYSETYAGGIFMEDTTWVKTYNNKALYVNNTIASTGNVIGGYSDERLKNKLGNIDNAVEIISKLNGFRYTNNDIANSFGYTETNVQIGLSAQEVENVLPELVCLAPFDMKEDEETKKIVSKSQENYKTVDYAKLVPVLIEAIKEQQKQIEELKSKIGN